MKIKLIILLAIMMMNCQANSQNNKCNELLDAVQVNDTTSIKELIKQGCAIDKQNEKGETALLIATHKNFVEAAKILMNAGANVNIQDNIKDSPFLYASAQGRTEILREMIKHKPNTKIYNRFGGNGVIPAAEKGHLENVKLLLEHTDMDVNHINNLGWTALLEAVILTDGSKIYQEIIKVLIKYGADVNIPDKNGVSALKHAKEKGYKEIEKILIEAGAKK